MTILAGIFSRAVDSVLPATLCTNLKEVVSRYAGDERIVFQDRRAYLVKVDTGAYGEAAVCTDPEVAVSLLAGEPLLVDGTDSPRGRAHDLRLLHDAWTGSDWSLLPKAQGVFCAVHYQPKLGRLSLVVDKLGIRQLYYWLSDQLLIFSSALRVLEQLHGWPKVMDLRSITEMAAFGFPLGSRTPYCNVELLKAAEVLTVSQGAVSRRQYWRWDTIRPSAHSQSERAAALYDRFTTAVTQRLRGDNATIAFLSGGLDSRCIVGLLRDRHTRVHTFAFFATETMQDRILAAAFARRAGTVHEERTIAFTKPHWSMLMAKALSESKHLATHPVPRPSLIWSGDGGSVGLGHVYVTQALVDLFRRGRRDAAIQLYLQRQGASVLRRLLQPHIGNVLAEVLHAGIREELDELHCEDPGRSFHIFLMLNDQRRHLAAHFEDIDLHRLEFNLPFFDSRLLELIVASPIDDCLGHGLYMRFAAQFPPWVFSVPWQTYPEHAPCPLPLPRNSIKLWDKRIHTLARRRTRRELLRHADVLLEQSGFPDELLRRGYLKAARLVHGLRLRDYAFVIEAARLYHKYWALCDGRYDLTARTNLPSVA